MTAQNATVCIIYSKANRNKLNVCYAKSAVVY